MKPYEKLQRCWRESAADIGTVELTEQAVSELEQKYGVRLPDDFREYLLYACPKNDSAIDQKRYLTSWWSLDRIKNIVDEDEHYEKITDAVIRRDAARYLFFADYSIWCGAWAIACGDDAHRGRIVVINGGDDRFVADSFAQFVERYITDYGELL